MTLAARMSLLSLALPFALALATPAAQAETANLAVPASEPGGPLSIGANDRARYAAIFAALRGQRWDEAKSLIQALDENDAMRPLALSELYLAKGSPKVELFDLLAIINKAPWLPRADQLSRLSEKRGATMLPALPQVQKMVWLGAAPRRTYLAPVKNDALAQALVAKILPFIKDDNPAGAEALLTDQEAGLTPEGSTEVRQRIAWSYYIENDDAAARRMAARALELRVGGEWAAQAHWTTGLAAWRQKDCVAAAPAFASVAALGQNDDMRAAGAYWASRAYMMCGQPEKVASLLRLAARAEDTFYGMLAREALGMPVAAAPPASFGSVEWRSIQASPNARAAIALAAIGENDKADELLRYQAKLGGGGQYDALLKLANALNLPETQLWLAHNGPVGKQPDSFARFPAPSNWRPDGGWRVDPALIYAHTLQESGFRANAVSSAGARGLMQVRPGTGGDMGLTSADQLFVPSTNMEFGQRYLEALRDMGATRGLLPKVMAAYNAGPAPVERWNYEVKDGGDPLLFIESLPYYETRAYVNIVMRNYWMYQIQAKGSAEALTGMAQGMWPMFPTTKGSKLVRLTRNDADGGFSGGAD